MADNWKSGWRKLVEWDSTKKVYIYKDKEIFPLSFKQQYEMPLHIQNSYYWGEISLIDNRIELEKKYQEQSKTQHFDYDKEWEEICKMLEW